MKMNWSKLLITFLKWWIWVWFWIAQIIITTKPFALQPPAEDCLENKYFELKEMLETEAVVKNITTPTLSGSQTNLKFTNSPSHWIILFSASSYRDRSFYPCLGLALVRVNKNSFAHLNNKILTIIVTIYFQQENVLACMLNRVYKTV